MRDIIYSELKVGDKVITRDGREGRVICTDFKGFSGATIICAVTNNKGCEQTIHNYKSGRASSYFGVKSDSDIFLPPKKEYVNLYRHISGDYNAITMNCVVNARDNAEDCSYGEFVKTIEVEL